MTNYPFRTADEHRDVEAVNHWKRVIDEGLDQQAALTGMAKVGRDNARTPVQWDASPTAGFTTGESWLPVNPNRSWLNAAAQVGKAGSVFEHYRALIRPASRAPGLRHRRLHRRARQRPGRLGLRARARATAAARRRELQPPVAGARARRRLGGRAPAARLRARRPAVLPPGPLALEAWESRIYLLD